ncbi:imidazole glycerol phosphate synthase subunit HisH [Striga asiatica]|uniref:Imidazole glycerol phosphate synthase subunit HisH n=1 Tax=Striga asiatica TaxID=4170 RepID=A0A5A7Q9P6_STRAF|nr:imidazole glycerol phosphate synthase subunit HisH [Striga asiatica]
MISSRLHSLNLTSALPPSTPKMRNDSDAGNRISRVIAADWTRLQAPWPSPHVAGDNLIASHVFVDGVEKEPVRGQTRVTGPWARVEHVKGGLWVSFGPRPESLDGNLKVAPWEEVLVDLGGVAPGD